MFNDDLFWASSIKDLKNGYNYRNDQELFVCLVCGKEYQRGIVYKIGVVYYEAEFAMKKHLVEEHGSSFDYLLSLDKKYNGLSDIQKVIAQGMYDNLTDGEIAHQLDNKAKSTIRNHRYVLREKYKEAKVFIALMELLDEKEEKKEKFINFHDSLPVNDDRKIVTEDEKSKIINKYFSTDLKVLKKFPKKQKEKLVLLQQIITRFDQNRKYTEKEINQILEQIYPDYVTIRRYLIDYNFLDRKSDCSLYWVKM